MPTGESRIIILGAGRSPRGGLPSALHPTPQGRVLDWILNAFSEVERSSTCFVGGYQAEVIARAYPEVELVINPGWRVTGPVSSLACARLRPGVTAWVCYADVVFRASTVAALAGSSADAVVAVDRAWARRYPRRAPREMSGAEKVRLDGSTLRDIGVHVADGAADGEFCGLVKLSPAAVEVAAAILASDRLPTTATMPALIRELVASGLRVEAIDIDGDWAELNAPQDLARFVLGTKAESLARLRPLLRSGVIGELVTLPYSEWLADPAAALAAIASLLPGAVIVRSSSGQEDGWDASAAGVHESVVCEDSRAAESLTAAIEAVFGSYGSVTPRCHVLVQRHLGAVASSGVIMTRTPGRGAPYYVINFDSSSRRTDTVTSGNGSSLRTVYLHRDAPLAPRLEGELGPVLCAVREIEALVGHDSLDVEYAVTDDGVVHVLQVRPIAGLHAADAIDDAAVEAGLRRAIGAFEQLRSRPSPFLVGSSTQLSVMSDWNPAEIVGVKPRRLALSLYRHLITDGVWALQRAENGYRDVRPCPLLVDLAGHPYVDVRATFNSFVPKSLPDALAGRLVDHYLARLRGAPELHDKVEFEVLITCLSFDIDARLERLREAGFSDRERDALRAGLRQVTRRSLSSAAPDRAALKPLSARQRALLDGDLDPLDRAFLLLEDCRRHGTPVFASLARSAFVAVSLLRSLVVVGALEPAQVEGFLGSLTTVSGSLQVDARRVARGQLEFSALVGEYGHLRPGTYDIRVPSYAREPEAYLRPIVEAGGSDAPARVEPWGRRTRAEIGEQLAALDLPLDVDSLTDFLRTSIEGREISKFVFTRSVSAALESITEFGARHGLDREELSHLSIDDLLRLRGAPCLDVEAVLRRRSEEGREAHALTQALCLPGYVAEAEELLCFERVCARPNFVTRRSIRGPLRRIDELEVTAELVGAVALIDRADPGYDWLFGRGIAGLITRHGGVNSHMAVRAAEFGLPAAIGVGDETFEALARAERVILDCESQIIRAVEAP